MSHCTDLSTQVREYPSSSFQHSTVWLCKLEPCLGPIESTYKLLIKQLSKLLEWRSVCASNWETLSRKQTLWWWMTLLGPRKLLEGISSVSRPASNDNRVSEPVKPVWHITRTPVGNAAIAVPETLDLKNVLQPS